MRRNLPQFVLPLVTLIGLILLWEVLVQSCYAGVIGSGQPANRVRAVCLIAAPSEAAAAAIRNADTLLRLHIPTTLLETLLGFAIALPLGVGLAALLDFWPAAKRAILPLLVISQAVPLIAVAPLLILIFGFGIEVKVVTVILFCFFPIAVSTVDGLNATDPDYVALLRAMGATRGQVWRKVRFPSALPSLFSGLRIAATFAVGGAVIGEFVTAQYGLGQYLRQAYNQRGSEQVFAAVIIIVALSIALVAIVALIERMALPWYYTEERASRWNEPGIY